MKPVMVCTICWKMTAQRTCDSVARLRDLVSADSWIRRFSKYGNSITSRKWNTLDTIQYTMIGAASESAVSLMAGWIRSRAM